MIYVIAGNLQEAKNWMAEHKLLNNKEARYLFDAIGIMSLPRGFRYVRVGGWMSSPNIDSIEAELKSHYAVEAGEEEFTAPT